ncbi:pyridoxamine 5'-phosphate oxidase family protein [uncultured Jannaschia sp.]|uniref:pyridoxamine 5'-phosphate oxidase family protein n=1 Tax=uncultured Jannaschia sp. TaxID=293347 RepID=UPI0026181E35|nr:pyridoxamine 5'-phosphate oxidase family protein [uncultured Jannaschia sp.]
MSTPEEIETKFWKALRSDMTVFIGCEGALPRPMVAIPDGDADHGPLWFFTSHESDLGKVVGTMPQPATMTFVDKGHDIWASASGTLTMDNDRAVIDRLWNPHVAAWYEEGKDDPKLRLIRYDVTDAELWEDGSSVVAGIKALMGSDPKKDFQDKTAHVRLDD